MKRTNKKYIEFIKKQPCLCCHNSEVDAHHIRERTYTPPEFRGGVGLKPNDFMCLPLCRKHHTIIHEHKTLIDNPGYEVIKMLCNYILELQDERSN